MLGSGLFLLGRCCFLGWCCFLSGFGWFAGRFVSRFFCAFHFRVAVGFCLVASGLGVPLVAFLFLTCRGVVFDGSRFVFDRSLLFMSGHGLFLTGRGCLFCPLCGFFVFDRPLLFMSGHGLFLTGRGCLCRVTGCF